MSSRYDRVMTGFRWDIPEKLNLGVNLCDRYADDAGRVALIYLDGARVTNITFHQLRQFSNKLGNALLHLGIQRGDRVGILLTQRPETAISHIACFKIGAISLPLFTQFGPDAIKYRLSDSAAKVVITDSENLPKLLEVRELLPHQVGIILVDADESDVARSFWRLLESASDRLDPVATRADDPAFIIYTSGTTGPPKGALHAHRIMDAHRPAISFTQDGFPQPGDLFWTPAEWAWGGGLFNSLFGSLNCGVPIIAHRFKKFDPEQALDLMAKHGVKNSFMPPTALKMMKNLQGVKAGRFSLRSMNSGGESLGAEALEWAREIFGVTINEFWGQTEANFLTGNSAGLLDVKPGSIGRPTPGHRVEVLNDEGEILGPGETGTIAALSPDPIFFLRYWNNEKGTEGKYRDGWLMTGDTGYKDEDGYFWFRGRNDDIISSGGYRIGPTEIENCICGHSEVGSAAVIGVPDTVRGEIIKAFVVLKEGVVQSADVLESIQRHVCQRLAAYQYPRAIEFVDQIPVTPTGKIQRAELRARERARAESQQQ